MTFNQTSGAAAAMEDGSANVVHLSGMHQGVEESVHRCGFNCSIHHVWGNLYLCKLSGTSHVCDKNCDQRIVYDNHSSICRASRQIFPLQLHAQEQPIQGTRRKNRECEGFETDAFSKRNRCFFSQEQVGMASGFASTYQDLPHCSASGESAMDVA
ncbi:hypothetical protein GOP47_0029644 [Adiantum capillus-veneris]|nr:hypothetical protein GOP47_0029644 [Adiantum capillus-veneris]